MQLARMLFLYHYQRQLRYKLAQLYLALLLERHFSKDEILELYLNSLFFANRIYGILQNIVNGCRGKAVSVVLQHDIKTFSVDVVRQVIRWGREQGYRFQPLERNSPAVRHRIAN